MNVTLQLIISNLNNKITLDLPDWLLNKSVLLLWWETKISASEKTKNLHMAEPRRMRKTRKQQEKASSRTSTCKKGKVKSDSSLMKICWLQEKYHLTTNWIITRFERIWHGRPSNLSIFFGRENLLIWY